MLLFLQSFLFFYDHMSKANWFLEFILKKVALPLESRELAYAFQNAGVQDGGVPPTIYRGSVFADLRRAKVTTILLWP